MSVCKSCGAEIVWIRTQAGKPHPLDAKPEKRWVALGDLTCGGPIDDRMDAASHGWSLVDTYVSHFATCPHAAEHRKVGE